MRRIITLTTDFGAGSLYVAAVKGVILSVNPLAEIVDICHTIRPQDIAGAAIVVDEASRWFPEESLHVAVVDPGVGTPRRILYLESGKRHFVAPDNGLLSLVARRDPPRRVISVENPEFWLPELSSTFHGRDIMAPVAARISMGMPATRLGPTVDAIESLPSPDPVIESESITGWVIWVDHFGNLVTNIDRAAWTAIPRGRPWKLRCAGRDFQELVRTYGDRASGEVVALFGSTDRLELSVVNGSAAENLQVGVDAVVTVSW